MNDNWIIRVPRGLAHRIIEECGASAFVVWHVLAGHADAKGECYPSLTTIARIAHLAKSTVQLSIRALVAKGFILKGSWGLRGTTYQLRGVPINGTVPESGIPEIGNVGVPKSRSSGVPEIGHEVLPMEERPIEERPRRVGPRKNTKHLPSEAAYHPDKIKPARAVVEVYKQAVGFAHGTAGAENAIVALFLDGHSKESLEKAARNYGQWCDREGREPCYRYGPTKFFGDGGFKDFLDGVPAPTKNNSHGARTQSVAERRAAEKAYLANGRGSGDRHYLTAAEIHEKHMREVK